VLGGSAARGQYAERSLIDALPASPDRRFIQRAFGADLEYSRDHWMVRADTVMSEWRIPAAGAPVIDRPLRAVAVSVEGRYAFLPGVYAAARGEHLAFNRIVGTARVAEWDAPVSRVEVGGGYYLQRNVVARMSVQFNHRDGGLVHNLVLPAVQILYWF
jgi:predicted porin